MDWAKPLTRVLLHRVIAWPSFRELAGNLERATIPVLGQLIDHRNRATGQCNPSRDVLGGETAYSPRTVSAATAQLMAKGLIGKEQARSRGWASTNDYWLTPKFFELVSRAYSVGPGCNFRRPPAAIFAARGLQFSQTNGDPPDPATWNAKGEGEPSAPPQRSPPRPSHRRPFFHAPPGFPPPHFSRGQKGGGGGIVPQRIRSSKRWPPGSRRNARRSTRTAIRPPCSFGPTTKPASSPSWWISRAKPGRGPNSMGSRWIGLRSAKTSCVGWCARGWSCRGPTGR